MNTNQIRKVATPEQLKRGALECLASHGAGNFCEAYDCRTVLQLIRQIECQKRIVHQIESLLESLPSGVDRSASLENESPEDMVAHIGGLIWQKCQLIFGNGK